ncbi:hypothetical protein OA958_04215 [Bacteroidota bacterium]|nr:hypothetical protein [Bacteroidota bacterium]
MIKNSFYDRNQQFKFSILSNKLFLSILIIKLIAGFFFASDFLTTLFYPFIDHFINNGPRSAYDSFYFSGKENSFPYPVLMLYIIGFFKFFFSNDNILSFMDLGLIRIPILLADFAIFLILCSWLKKHQLQVIFFYWLNPILFYINYLHGQLDVIPTAFLIISLYFIFKRNWVLGSVFAAFSILCKTNFIIVIPFLVLYMFKSGHFNFKKVIMSLAIILLLVFIVQVPFLSNNSYLITVYNNSTQAKLLNLFLNFEPTKNILFYIAPSAIILLIFYGITFQNFNKNLFILFLGFSFASISLLTPPSQGWYCWFLPMFIYFLIKNSSLSSRFFYWTFIVAYFIYFLVFQESDFFNLTLLSEPYSFYQFLPFSEPLKDLIVNFSFTFLQITLLTNCVLMLVKGIESYKKNKFLYQPLLIGIGGDSSAGKTTFSKVLQNLYGNSQTTIIRGDDMHKWERGDQNWNEKTHLNPLANHIHREIEFIRFLKKGISIKRRSYDHGSGKFTIPSKIESKRVIIYEGLHPFYLSDMKNSFDISFFIQPDEELRRKWKIERDTKERGYSKEKILSQLKDREKDSFEYIQSQSEKADVWVNLKQSNEDGEKLILNLKINSNLDLESLLSELGNLKEFNFDYDLDNLFHHLVFYNGIDSKKAEDIAHSLNPEIDELLSPDPIWENDFNGILQLIQITCLQSKLANE